MTIKQKITALTGGALAVIAIMAGYIYAYNDANRAEDVRADMYPYAKNVMELKQETDALELVLRNPIYVDGHTTFADSIAIYYDADKPASAEYTTVIKSKDNAGTVYSIPTSFTQGEWHFSLFSGTDMSDPDIIYFKNAADWLSDEYVMINLGVQQFGEGFNFVKQFSTDGDGADA